MNRLLGTLMLALLLAVAACGAGDPAAEPTPTPPDAALALVLVPPAPVAADDARITSLRDALFQQTGLSVDIIAAQRPADALTALCGSGDLPTAAWLNGLSAAAALAQECGQPMFKLARSDTASQTAEATEEASPEAETPTPAPDDESADSPESAAAYAYGVQFIFDPDLGTTQLSALQSRVFCRVSAIDEASWLVPALMLRSASVDINSASEIRNYEDYGALIDAVASGECAMAAVPTAAGLDLNGVAVGPSTGEVLPFGLLAYDADIELGVRLALNDALASPEVSALLLDLMGASRIEPLAEGDLDALRGFIATTGNDLITLGQ